MSAHAEDIDRRLIPRWRFADQLSFSPEFAGDPRLKRTATFDRSHLDQKLAEWHDEKDIGRAIDLISCGLGGGWRDDVLPAAEFLLSARRAPVTAGARTSRPGYCCQGRRTIR